MPAQATKKFPKRIPYGYSYPSVDQDMIKRRMCSHCGLYSSSLKAKSLHEASCRVTEGHIENTTACATIASCCPSAKGAVVCDGVSRDRVGLDE